MKTALLLLAVSAPACAAEVSIRNEFLQVRLDGDAFTVTSVGSARPFAREGRLSASGGAPKSKSVADKTFGKGECIEVRYPNGNIDRILLFPRLPFALFRSTVHNGGHAALVLERPRPVGFTAELGLPLANVRVLGTGGLSSPEKAQGSYMWLAVADPNTRQGVVSGWLTTDRGSGVVFPEVAGGALNVNAQIDYGKLCVAAGKDETLETFALGYFADARLGLEGWADAVAKVYAIKLPPQPTVYCTWYHAGASDEKKLAAQADFAAKNLKPYGFSVVQIDDGWQDGVKGDGPRRNFTQVRPGGPYPSGMKATADHIKADGLAPGIWFMPFAGTAADPWFADKQDWFARREDGSPYTVRWGGTSLDMTHPGAREYLRNLIHRIAHEWGYEYFKMDGLWTGTATEMNYINDAYKEDKIGNAALHDPNQTNIEAFRSGLKLVRETAGPKVFILGCTVAQNMRSYGGAFGLVDAMRIGPDNGANWKSILRGPTSGGRNYFLHNRVWYNDPDPLYVRSKLPLNQARMISAWVTVSGQLNASSDAFADLPPERLDLLRRTMPAHGLQARPADLLEEAIPRIWTVSKGDRHLVAVFNWSDQDATIEYPWDKLGLDPARRYVAYEYWSNTLHNTFERGIKAALPAPTKPNLPATENSSAIFAVRALEDHPQVISTSRHITQGLIDVLEEHWSGPELSGVSRVVAGDPYELRVLRSSTRGTWPEAAAEVSAADRAAGVKISAKEDSSLCRVTIDSPAGRDVRWKVRFKALK